MNNILRVLVPINFTAESQLALEWAQTVAKNKTGTTVYLMHVLPLKETPQQLGVGSVGYEMEMDSIKSRMQEWLDKLPKDLLAFALYETGSVADAVAKVCKEKDIDLVVMTTRGRRGLTHILKGSTTEETIRVAPCPVLVLHLNSRTQNLAQTSKAVNESLKAS